MSDFLNFLSKGQFLDSLYRVLVSFAFIISALSIIARREPLVGFHLTLEHLGIPAEWVVTVSTWSTESAVEISVVGGALLTLGTLTVRDSYVSRTASTQLLGLTLLLQVHPNMWMLFLVPIATTIRMGAARIHAHTFRPPNVVLTEALFATFAVILLAWGWLTGNSNSQAQSEARTAEGA